MQPALQKILVVGGNGFIGSAVCRAALRRGYQVTSISSSGRPFQTPKGHTPVWTEKVEWVMADALRPETYSHILPGVSAVVHTLGTLFANTNYKDALRRQDLVGVAGIVLQSLTGTSAGGNPLEEHSNGYETLNRDSAVRVAEAFMTSSDNAEVRHPRPFVYISAEDIFRPVVPAAYIETKRDAEERIERIIKDKTNFRGVYLRPSLVYHPHLRPYTAVMAALLDLSSTVQSKFPKGMATPSELLHRLSHTLIGPPSVLDSIGRALSLPPIHVDQVAEAVCVAVDSGRPDVRGVYGVQEMQDLVT
ncbi:NAD(P)-binding protein [Multifurca ochricompacta]|uniref:NAD(P)-binding protein n=1 Tax=Multifurca ochricompacta TaxID=376703 RepID=A0AAD4MAG5_9AGAM|nr:NAD(P)-binding protein [Multifurca ochricompacta]